MVSTRKKTTSRMIANWRKGHADGVSVREMAERDGVDEKTIRYHLFEKAKRANEAPSKPPEAIPEEPVDESEMTPQEFARWLTGQMRAQQSAARRMTEAGDNAGAQRATRIAASLAGTLLKLQQRDEDGGEHVKVRLEDMRATADRAMQSLSQLADRVIAERATWPKCQTCGSACGEFAAGEKSPMRALFERVAR